MCHCHNCNSVEVVVNRHTQIAHCRSCGIYWDTTKPIVNQDGIELFPAANPRPEHKGIWFVYGLDQQAYPLFMSDEEIEALRWCVMNPGSYVQFWEYNTPYQQKLPSI